MKINIDLSEVVAEFEDLTTLQVNDLAKSVLQATIIELYRNWTDAAKKQLHSTRFQYLRGLQIIDIGAYSKAIVLNGKLPNMIESGCTPFDMKQAFRNSAKIKFNKKGGWYLTIPFRFGVPTTLGESESFTDILPPAIHDLMVKKRAHITSTKGIVTQRASALKAKEIPRPYNALGIRNEIKNKLETIYAQYQHKSSIYAGVQKETGIYEKAAQNTYVSFRRMGQNSDPLSWIHSGIKEYNLAKEAVNNTDVDTITENVIDDFLNG